MKTPEQLESRRRYRRKWMENNPEAMDKARERWRLNNHDRILRKRRERIERLTGRKVVPRGSVSESEKLLKARRRSNKWYHAHKHKIKDKMRAWSLRYRLAHPRTEKLTQSQLKINSERQKVWRAKNKDKMRRYSFKERQNPQRLIQFRLRARINKMLRVKGARRSYRTVELIGCSWAFLKSYIEGQFSEGMSWRNRNLWHIDHVKPCAKFDLTDPEQQKECFRFTNLQPLWAADNMAKGARYVA